MILYPPCELEEREKVIKFFTVLFVIVAIIFGFVYIAAVKNSEKTTVVLIEDKESVTVSDGDGGSKNEYRIYTNKGVYVVSDTIVYWNFRAADRYAQLKVGKTYKCKQAYWRIGFFSMFPNLIECELNSI